MPAAPWHSAEWDWPASGSWRTCFLRRPGAPSLPRPRSREDIEFVPALGVLVGTEDQGFSVRRELREAGKSAKVGDLFEPGAVHVHQIEFELAAVAFVLVRRKQDLLSVRCECRSKTGAAEIRDLPLIFPVGVC